MKNKVYFILTLTLLMAFSFQTKAEKWKKGIVTKEFIYEKAPFPECHAATIAETPEGLIVAWFGGMKERYKDVCIYTSMQVNGKWTEPEKVADGKVNDTLTYACWNPVLYYHPEG